jgi:uncharacterized protein involved in exopolysaccharide biosynthesis
MRDFVRVWFFWKHHALIVFLLVIFLVMSFSYLYTPNYESSAKIMILPRTGEGAIISVGTEEKRVSPVSIEDINTEIELLLSEDVLRKTVRSFMAENGEQGLGLKARRKKWHQRLIEGFKRIVGKILIVLKLIDPLPPFESDVKVLKNALEVEPVAMSSIILVSLRAESPKVAAVVLNRLLDIYIRHHNDVLTKEEGVQFFSDQATKFRRNLEIYEQKLQQFQRDSNIVDLKSQNEANIELLSDLKKSLRLIEISYDEAKSRIEMLQNMLLKNINEIVITKEMRTIPAIVELERGLVPLLIKRSEIKKHFTQTSREYSDVAEQIGLLRNDINNEIKKAIKTDQLELESFAIKKRSLQEKINDLNAEAANLKQKEKSLKDLKRQIALYNNSYLLYASKAEDARIFSERKKRDLANVSIASNASIPVKPAFPNRLLMLLISIFVGLFVSLGLPFFLEFLDHRLKTANDVENILSLPVVCSISEVKNLPKEQR